MKPPLADKARLGIADIRKGTRGLVWGANSSKHHGAEDGNAVKEHGSEPLRVDVLQSQSDQRSQFVSHSRSS